MRDRDVRQHIGASRDAERVRGSKKERERGERKRKEKERERERRERKREKQSPITRYSDHHTNLTGHPQGSC